jgi:hypothetical protein
VFFSAALDNDKTRRADMHTTRKSNRTHTSQSIDARALTSTAILLSRGKRIDRAAYFATKARAWRERARAITMTTEAMDTEKELLNKRAAADDDAAEEEAPAAKRVKAAEEDGDEEAAAEAGDGEEEDAAAADEDHEGAEDDAAAAGDDAEQEEDAAAAGVAEAAPAEPVQLGYKRFKSGNEARSYFAEILKNYTIDQPLNEVRGGRAHWLRGEGAWRRRASRDGGRCTQ